MAILKCKMCGGDLNNTEGMTVCECEYCNTKQTVPTIDDEKKVKLFDRANRLRMECQFDKAAAVYETIVEEFETDAEGYWGLLLCKFGIEYVDDPATGDKVPTCHRSSFDSFMDDKDFEMVMEYSDSISRSVYREQAKQIEEIRKGIIEVSGKEEPYDIFICYKETAEDGQRTLDSVLAQDVYDVLVGKGYRVFFSRLTLEDKLGTEYEPYIFAALNSAKIMLAFGTSYDYFNAVWVKNEWSRYLKLMAKDKSKHLIPCYKDIDAYDIPKEFAKLQAQDLGKVGATQDLIRGIEKILHKNTEVVKETIVVQGGNSTNIKPLLDRGNMALEDSEWDKANGFYEEVLNQDAKCADAYLGKLLAASKADSLEEYFSILENKYLSASIEKLYACKEETEHIDLVVKENALEGYLEADAIKKVYIFDRSYSSALSCRKEQKTKQQAEIDSDKLLARVRQYATGELKDQIESGLKNISAILDTRIIEEQQADETQITEITANYQFHIEEADRKVRDMRVKADKEKYKYYETIVADMHSATTVSLYEKARDKFSALGDYEDSFKLVKKCQTEIDRINEEERQEKARLVRKAKRITIVSISTIIVAIVTIVLIVKVVIPNSNYNKAVELKNNGQYTEAIAVFENLDGYKDSDNQILECNYNLAVSYMNEGHYTEAIAVFENLDSYKDSDNQIVECKYNLAVSYMNEEQYSDAVDIFRLLNGYNDSEELITTCEIQNLSNLSIGDSFYYGSYDNEPLEWTILYIQNNQILAITTDAIDERPYNNARTDVTWASCTLRTWLNGEFINETFSSGEQSRIITTTVSPGNNPDYNTNVGIATEDKVFLLSIDEFDQYFSSNASVIVCEYNGNDCWWWVRSPADDQGNAVLVYGDGSGYYYGIDVVNYDYAVRPAMWINIDS